MRNGCADTPLLPGEFPAPLVCPKCGHRVMTGRICEQSRAPCASEYCGIPRFLFGQEYWGETSIGKMHSLLARAEETHWRRALEMLRGEAIAEHLLSPIRADFLHTMPWAKIRDVLDVGAGMGFMSCDMARYARSVTSLEAVPERAKFIQIRARQDELPVFPVIASAMEMPFAPESFDLITLNGVFEYIGLWGQGDPAVLQRQFLETARSLLRPGGYLYVGIENRLAMSAFLGARDHSGLRFTSLMPRRVADWYCRLRAHPMYGAERPATGYRTYTHTPARYARLFRDAGFANPTVYGVHDGYNRQKAVYRMDDHAGRSTVLCKVDPPASLAGKLRRLVEDNRHLYRTLEREVVIFARKGGSGDENDMPWAPMVGAGRTVAQISLPFKVLGIVLRDGTPLEVLEVAKRGHEEAAARLEACYQTLTALESAARIHAPLPMRWPKPMERRDAAGRSYWRYEYVSGRALSSLLLPSLYSEREVFPLIERAVAAYVSLCRWMSGVYGQVSSAEVWTRFEADVARTAMGADIRRDVQAALEVARAEDWKLSAIHGDFTAGNLLVRDSGELVLIDWEHCRHFPLGTDLIRFHNDVLMEAARLPAPKYRRLRSHVGQTIQGALRGCGYLAPSAEHLRALYIGHQVLALGGEKNAYGAVLKAYREGRSPFNTADRPGR